MRQMGADTSNEQLRRSLLFEDCVQDGEAALKLQLFDLARSAYADALEVKPQDLGALLTKRGRLPQLGAKT